MSTTKFDVISSNDGVLWGAGPLASHGDTWSSIILSVVTAPLFSLEKLEKIGKKGKKSTLLYMSALWSCQPSRRVKDLSMLFQLFIWLGGLTVILMFEKD